MLLKLLFAGAAGYGLYKYTARKKDAHAAYATGEVSTGTSRDVRNAGPESMRDKPDNWQPTDEESDQSFPASDPPANY
jgi:hypothetical protein